MGFWYMRLSCIYIRFHISLLNNMNYLQLMQQNKTWSNSLTLCVVWYCRDLVLDINPIGSTLTWQLHELRIITKLTFIKQWQQFHLTSRIVRTKKLSWISVSYLPSLTLAITYESHNVGPLKWFRNSLIGTL